jgi:hypothetical protein
MVLLTLQGRNVSNAAPLRMGHGCALPAATRPMLTAMGGRRTAVLILEPLVLLELLQLLEVLEFLSPSARAATPVDGLER